MHFAPFLHNHICSLLSNNQWSVAGWGIDVPLFIKNDQNATCQERIHTNIWLPFCWFSRVREEEYRDKEPALNGESRHADGQEDTRGRDAASPAGSGDRYEERSERDYDRRSDYNDRRSDYDDRRSDYTDRRDRNERYDSERHYDDERRYDDRRYDDDRYDEPYDDRGPPRVPANKPTRRDYDD